ncbi:glycine--tRNA ligase subunit beta [Desulfopila inferna]|uniref:glycine--tRNA ligase subunit beta n=1 Tax=Desulfopila inferna TaxID=468528 RepID=UPI0019661349|nr:glycine--tRNA ligase subunit beta [Desulfopila inferna]MBM9603146.1 glycine--tRNA ligase subunit beta [Desulfopila inferna]
MSNLLFEIGTEELPAGYIEPALAQLREKFTVKASDLRISHGEIRTMATPRRLTLIVEDLAGKQKDMREEIIGPSAKAGLDAEGKPTKAALGFAGSKGASPDDLQIVATSKGDYLMLVREVPGQEVQELLPDILHQLIVELSFPKSMRWGGNSSSFARPIQWLLALNGGEVVKFKHEDIETSNISRGHRFLNNYEIAIGGTSAYENQLAEANVIVDPRKRKDAVVKTINEAVAASETLSHGQVFIDSELLDTVTNLVELPCGVCGVFDQKFLDLPDEVLITSMREHQKYFPVVDDKGNLLAGFVAVNNTKTEDESITRKGHQRVLRARLEDALFFFAGDKERSLDELIPELKGIIFQARLGTMLAKNDRLVKLSRMLAEKLAPEDVEDVCRAAMLCKADLLTDMVGEFPSLQGVMGEAYATLSGEKPQVALAIREHYMPKRSGAELPTQTAGALVGLADRIDTLAGCFGIGQIPTGGADPFGLRRISLAILHIIRKNRYSLSLREVVHKALALYGDKVDGSSATVDAVLSFVEGRYRNDCIAKGWDAEAVAAAAAVGFDDPNDCWQRIEALSEMKADPAFGVLASSYKRIKNIIIDNRDTAVRDDLLVENAEKDLFQLLIEVRRQMEPLLTEKNYRGYLKHLLKMKEPVDVFFDEVMVMAEEPDVRCNRLNLLTALGELVLQIGDISMMHEG